jgi:hypothetical protein
MNNSIDDDDNYPNTNPKYTDLTAQAKLIINSLERTTKASIIDFHEHYSYGDCDEMGPTEHFWTLYVIMENHDFSITNHKYYREVFEMQRDEDSNIFYESCEMNKYDNTFFSTMIRNAYEGNKIENMDFESLTVHAQRICSGLSDIMFVNEHCESENCCRDGPAKQMWTLIVAFQNEDEIAFEKYYREVNERNDKHPELINYAKVDLNNCDDKIIAKIAEELE